MATKSTIFKLDLQIADFDRNYFGNHALTLARHPSETDERMMMRALAFMFHASPALEFGKGLSADDEPDLWRKDATGIITHWIMVGLPDEKRIRRACGRAAAVVVMTYGGRGAELWWQQNHAALERQGKLTVLDLPQAQTQSLARLASRSMQIQCTVQEGELWLIAGGEYLRISPVIRCRALA